jgi:hypothetical protein
LTASLGLVAALVGCGEKDVVDTDSGWGDADTDADSDSDTDADSDTDSDADADTALFGYAGEATVSPGSDYAGVEIFYAYNAALGGELCAYQWAANDTATLSCDDCDWAFTVEMTPDTYTTNNHAGCAPEADLATTASYDYGYGVYEYGGSEYSVLKYQYGGTWYDVALATFDGSTFTYDWALGAGYL